MYLQLMHVGRVGQVANRSSQEPFVAPSAIRCPGQIMTGSGLQDFSTPRALETAEVSKVIAEYAEATRNGFLAGFDGVQLHAASGYLPMQFLSSGTNRRTDKYGGSVQNRIRFVLETLEAMIAAAGSASRVSLKISPAMPFNDCEDENPIELYSILVRAVAPMGLSFLHVLQSPPLPNIFEILRPLYPGTFAAVGGFNRDSGNAALASGIADFIVYGKLFIANPDLPERFAKELPLNEWDSTTFYQGGTKGYIDYPTYSATVV
jgi:N-ethylmaleimide reductase